MESQQIALTALGALAPVVSVALLWVSRDGRSGPGARTVALLVLGTDFAIVLDAAALSPVVRAVGAASLVATLAALFEGGRELIEDVDWNVFAREFAEYVARMDVDEGRR